MTTATNLSMPAQTFSSDATFRTWGSAISALIAASGLVQTSDTGQINWAAVAKPASGNTNAGYEVYRFADAQQSATPIFVKVYYGTGGSSSTPRIIMDVGTSTDGAGTLGSAITGVVAASVSTDATSRAGVACHAEGSFALNLGRAATSNCRWLWSITRSVDADGTPNDDAIAVTAAYGGAVTATAVYRKAIGSWTTLSTSLPLPNAFPVIQGASGAAGSILPVYPVTLWTGDASRPVQPTTGLVIVGSSDVSAGTPISVSRFGDTRTYMPADVNPLAAGAPAAAAFLWE